MKERTLLKTLPLLSAILLAGAAAAPQARASVASLEVSVGAGPCGGSIGCTVGQDQTVEDPPATKVLALQENRAIPNAYANAYGLASFGTQRAYADAYNAAGGYAETGTITKVNDLLPADQISAGSHTFNFSITGWHSDVEPVYGAYAYAYFQFLAYDSVTGGNPDNTIWESTDAVPEASLTIPVSVTPGHGISFEVTLDADAYVSSFDELGQVTADYSKTLTYYVTGPGSLIGASGHDYSVNPAAAPEPATWALILLGFAAAGFARLRGAKAAFI